MPGSDVLLWMPWALALSAVAAFLAVRAARRGEPGRALRWSGWALVPPALLLTGTLRLIGRITGAVLDWSASLAFNPATWLGVGLGGVAVVLLVTSRVLDSRRSDEPAARPGTPPVQRGRDDDLTEIEDILRRRGIS